MRLSRIIIALMAGFAMLAVPTAVGAAPAVQPQPTAPGQTQPPYPPGLGDLTVSQSTVVVGEAVELHGEYFTPGETIDISVSINPLASAPLDAPLDVQQGRRS